MKQKYKFLEHTADIKFQAFGKTLEEVFKNSALAMLENVYDGKVKSKKKLKIKVKGEDLESLMYNFLEEFLVLLDGKKFIFSVIKNLKINQKTFTLTAELSGDSVENYKIIGYIKSVTYNEMFIKRQKKVWVAQVVIDV